MYSCTTSNVQSVYSHILLSTSLGIHPTCLVLPCLALLATVPSLPAACLASLSSKKGKNSTVKKLTVNSKKPVRLTVSVSPPSSPPCNFPPSLPNPLSLLSLFRFSQRSIPVNSTSRHVIILIIIVCIPIPGTAYSVQVQVTGTYPPCRMYCMHKSARYP